MSDIKTKSFSGFGIALSMGSKRKQRLSNYLRIDVESDRASISQRLTIREAKALQKWLNDNLGSEITSAE